MIRFATISDLPELYSLCLRCHREYPLAPELDNQKVEDQLVEWVSADRHEKVVLVAEKDGKIFGVLFGLVSEFFFSSKKQAYEVLWYVLPEYSKHKDSLRLFRAYEIWADKLNCFSIHTSEVVSEKWPHLEKFYLKNGYTKTETAYRKVL